MSDRAQEPLEQDELPEVEVQSRRGISIVWLIPLVAGAIAVWLGYTTIMGQGPTVSITFLTAAGLEAGKTKVKYRDVDVGLVEEVRIAEGGAHIAVTASLKKGAEPHLTEGTKFWVVRPRLSAGGVSGLGTLVSGAYIEMEPGTGAATTTFTGLEVPPVVLAYEEGRKFLLQSDRLGSLNAGSPIYYRGIEVGQVLGYELAGEGKGVTVHIFVKEPHFQLIRDNSRFWNASGIDVSVGADGFTISTASLEAILAGGIAFDTPVSATSLEPAAEGTTFKLFDDLASVTEATYTDKTAYVAYFDDSVRGLQIGAPVEFKGIRVGSVTDVALEFNRRTASVRIPVTFQIEPQRVNVVDVTGPVVDREPGPHDEMARLVERGLRAQLRSGSLLTGQLVLALDFHPDSPPAELRLKGAYPEVPTVPSDLKQITQSVEQVLAKLANLPMEELFENLRQTVKTADQTLTDVRALIRNVDSKAGPLLESATDTTKAAELALQQAKTTLVSADGFVGEKSEVRYELVRVLEELREASRSIRFLADYLEQHPEALLRGKASLGE